MSEVPDLLPPPRVTHVEVTYPPNRGTIGLRGSHAPLSWEHTQAPIFSEGDRHRFEIPVPPGEILELKVMRNQEEWAGGRNFVVHAGDHLALEPCFDTQVGRLRPRETFARGSDSIEYEVFLPPSYEEQDGKRYPVLYCQDGQALWSKSQDPFGVWRLDQALNSLYELGAIEELIVVGIHTSERRLERLTPVADPELGGGGALEHLRTIADGLRPYLDATLRTRPGRENTALLGSSLGGLFSFFAAWSRPEVFGKAACLSSSFWWGNRWTVRLVQQGPLPTPQPQLYLDSGASPNPHEQDASVRDGFHHTRSMFRALAARGFSSGQNLHRLVFTGATHDAPSWSQRVMLPLQLLFPPNAE